MSGIYTLSGAERLNTPSLVFYRDIITANTEKVIAVAGGADLLWPHVKTHKTSELVSMQMRMGIRRFKASTIAEAEMLARCEAQDILLAYPLVGAAISRFLQLTMAYPQSRFWAIGDNAEQLSRLSEQSARLGRRMSLLIDLDVGMHRTGVLPDQAAELYRRCAALEGLQVQGFHCYDGHLHMREPAARDAAVAAWLADLEKLERTLERQGPPAPVRVLGGSPTFPFLARRSKGFFSPGTVFLWDHGYASHFPDIDCTPGAALLCRVVSHPGENLFTLDLGHKAIAADPEGARGLIVGLEDAEPLGQSEEHWVFAAGSSPVPEIGAIVYVIPTHICPTVALHASVLVAERGSVVNSWNVAARARTISI